MYIYENLLTWSDMNINISKCYVMKVIIRSLQKGMKVNNFPTLLYYLKVHLTMTFPPFSRLKDMKNHTFFLNIK